MKIFILILFTFLIYLPSYSIDTFFNSEKKTYYWQLILENIQFSEKGISVKFKQYPGLIKIGNKTEESFRFKELLGKTKFIEKDKSFRFFQRDSGVCVIAFNKLNSKNKNKFKTLSNITEIFFLWKIIMKFFIKIKDIKK